MFPTTQNSATDLQAMLGESQVNETTAGGKAFMKLMQDGDFVYGRDSEVITGDQIVINTASILHGWTLWVNGSPKKVAAPFNRPLPDCPPAERDNKGKLREASESRSFEARFLDDDDTIITFDSNSYGGRKGVDAVLNAIKQKAVGGEANFLYPIIQLDTEHYDSDEGKKIYNPVFTIKGWMDGAGNVEGQQAKLEAAPAAEEKAEAAPAAEEEVEVIDGADVAEPEAAPKRRRRKPAAE